MYQINEYIASLSDTLLQYDLTIDEARLALCIQHAKLMLEAQKTVNLTAITDKEQVLEKHILDSLLLLPFVNSTSGRIIDIGTGGGYPGLPLAVCSQRYTVLLDSTKKKVDVLNKIVDELGVSSYVHPVCDRVEDYAKDHKYFFGCAVSRATAPLPVLLEYASPLLEPKGTLIAAKGKPNSSEEDAAKDLMHLTGLHPVNQSEYQLPSGAERTIYVYQKQEEARAKLPRRAGIARKRSLTK